MAERPSSFIEHPHGGSRWYDLFSRGARDWLRHSDKVSEAVREKLPELMSQVDVLGPKRSGTVRVPVRFLEHYRFRLREDDQPQGIGQGSGEPGDTLVPAQPQPGQDKAGGGNNDGGYQFVLEFKLDDIVDWLWEELQLPNMKRKEGQVRDVSYSREGWNRHGVRSRLDRRRSVKEALKRRARQQDGPPFSNDDLRFRQLVMRKQPSTEAVVFFAMDVSSSMTQQERQLAKTFFFWVVQGLRRQYTHIEPVFIAHTVEAWEFAEEEFFQVTGAGGTMASTAFGKMLEITNGRFDPGRYNVYLFYASDGENFSHDSSTAKQALGEIAEFANFIGYVETAASARLTYQSEMSKIFEDLKRQSAPVGAYKLHDPDSVWGAIRSFFTEEALAAETST
jgi:uncharacterized sporulation protein YeaH/YhbH (DUF444 family)